MKFLFDLFPVILFFAAFKFAGIYVATGVAIAATLAQVVWLKLRRRRVEPMLWASLAIICVFGGATLFLQDRTFIQWKPTVLYWLFALVLAGGSLLFRRNMMRAVMGGQMELPDRVWSAVNWSWAAFFLFMGVANLYVAFSFSRDWCADVADMAARETCAENMWVNFKLFGGTGLMLVFVIAQAILLARHIQPTGPEAGGSGQ